MTVFSDIYRDNRWNGVESMSGPGSGYAPTLYVAQAIEQLVIDINADSVLDVACGDGYWMPDLPNYVGIDVAPEAIALARKRHPGRTYEVSDIRDFPPRPFDLVIFRDAIHPRIVGLSLVTFTPLGYEIVSSAER